MVPRAQCEAVLTSLSVDWLEASKGVGAGTATWDSTVEASVESADFHGVATPCGSEKMFSRLNFDSVALMASAARVTPVHVPLHQGTGRACSAM